MPRIMTPDGPVDFPESMSQGDIEGALQRLYPPGKQATNPQAAPAPAPEDVTPGLTPERPHVGYRAMVNAAMTGANPEPKPQLPSPRELAGQYGDIASGIPTGIGAGIGGTPGDIESLMRLPGSLFGMSRENQWLPTSTNVGDYLAGGPAANGYVGAGRMIGGLLTPYASSAALRTALLPAARGLSSLRTGMNAETAAPSLASQALRETATGPVDFEQPPLPNMNLSTGQLSNNQGILFAERAAERQNPNVMNAARNAEGTNNRVITDTINSLGNPDSVNASATMGERVRAARDAAREASRADWRASGVDENTTKLPIAPLKTAVNDYIGGLAKADRRAVPSEFTSMLDDLNDTGEPIREIQALRSQVGGMARAAKDNPNTSRILRGLEDRIESYTNDALLNDRTAPILPDVAKSTGPTLSVGGTDGPQQTLFQRIRAAGGMKTTTNGATTKEGQDIFAGLQDQYQGGLINKTGRGERPDVLHGILHREGWFGGDPRGPGNIQDLYSALRDGRDSLHPEAQASANVAGANAQALEDARDLAKQYGIPVQDHWGIQDIHDAINDTEAATGRTSIDLGPYNKARQSTRNLKRVYNTPQVIRDILGTDRFGEAKTVASDVANSVIRSNKSAGAPEDLGHYLTAVGNDPQGMQAAKDAFAEKFIQNVQGTETDVNGLRKVMPAKLTKFIDDHQHVINSPLYTDAERNTVNQIQRASEMAARVEKGVPRGGSDTASNLAGKDFLNTIVGRGPAAAVNAAPAIGGVIGGTIGGKLGSVVGATVPGAIAGTHVGSQLGAGWAEKLYGPTRDRTLEMLQEALKNPDMARRLLASGTPNVNAGRNARFAIQGPSALPMSPALLARLLGTNVGNDGRQP